MFLRNEICFVLQEAELWWYITDDQINPKDHIKKNDINKDRLEKINKKKLNLLGFDKKKQQIIDEIGKMWTENVQQEFLALKNVFRN